MMQPRIAREAIGTGGSVEAIVGRDNVGRIVRVPNGIRDDVLERIRTKRARVGVVGLGYVGLPLALSFSRAGFHTLGFERDPGRARSVNEGRSYISDVTGGELSCELTSHEFSATLDFSRLAECDCVAICVPTPLSRTNDPDLCALETAVLQVRTALRRGQLIVLESTTYPGCTDEFVLDELRGTGLELDTDFLLAFSPERVDPGNADFTIADVPRIVGGCSADSAAAAALLYEQVAPCVHTVSSARVAETAKLLENTFRAVNIGLVNELALMCSRMNIDIWEVIDAAKTKPYGFMPFYPGPGIGGHCIPLDPVYLSWRGRQFGFASRFIDVAQQINAAMPAYVVQLIGDALNHDGKALNGARVLVLGAAYKKNVADLRESPAVEIIQMLRERRARVAYHDPFVPSIDFDGLPGKLGRDHVRLAPNRRVAARRAHDPGRTVSGRRSADPLTAVPLTDSVLAEADCTVIVTDHASIDYARVARLSSLVVDTRNAIDETMRAQCRARVVRL